jgi:hypothetical protein
MFMRLIGAPFRGAKAVYGKLTGGTLKLVEWACNIFLFLVPVVLAVYSSVLWLKSGEFHWIALQDFIRWVKWHPPEKLPTAWVGLNRMYDYVLHSPLALVSITVGLGCLLLGSLLATVSPRGGKA